MAEIATIQPGMQFGEVFAIVNQLIAGFNQLRNAVGGCLTDGILDYNKLGNKPRINGIELLGDRPQAELQLEADAETLQAVRDLGVQVDGMTTERQGYVLRIVSLETNRTADIARVVALEGEKSAREQDLTSYKATINALATSVSERMGNVESRESSRNTEYRNALQQVQTGLQKKADAASTPSTATWQNLKAAMDADVARAEAAVDNMASNEDFQEVVTRLKSVINRLNITVTAAQAAFYDAGACGDTIGRECVSPIDNNFSFDE